MLADAVDHQLQRGGAVEPVGLGAPGQRRLGDRPVELLLALFDRTELGKYLTTAELAAAFGDADGEESR